MSLLTSFPPGYAKPEPLNKSFDMIVRDWSRQQFGGDAVVEEIRKALSTGIYSRGAIAPGGEWVAGEASALRLENLDNTMTSVLATAEHLKIFRFLHKEPSKQPFYQWNRRDSYGSTRGFFGFKEGGLPTGGQGQWSRHGAYVKFLGTKGGVTHPVVLTNILGGMSMDPVAEDQLGRTMDFMQRIERAVMYGDEDITDDKGGDTNYDGLLKQLTVARPKNVIDLGGKPLNLDVIAGAATRLVTEGKLLSFNDLTLFMSPQNIEDLGKLRYQTILGDNGAFTGPGTTVDRLDLTTAARNNLTLGLSVVGQATAFGVIPFEWSIFTEPIEGGLSLNSLGSKADAGSPAAPALDDITARTSTNANATSNFTPTNAGGDLFHYAISSVSDVGESLAAYGGAVEIYANQEVVLDITRVTGDNRATAYRVYRVKNATPQATVQGMSSSAKSAFLARPDWRFVGYVADTGDTNTTVQFIDRNGTAELHNNFMPDTNIAPLVCRNPADLVVAQMSPLLKMPLAPVSTTFEYLLLLYHTLVLKAPERQIIFKNVGALS